RQGQAHYSGWYWSATTGGHVVYESRLELARLLMADFDPQVTASPSVTSAPGRPVRGPEGPPAADRVLQAGEEPVGQRAAGHGPGTAKGAR
ncbi:MAG TPA: hypothetical protein VFQ68_00300, partial [Streptosporangiaceae bacterium]|nr:hypothetical protein [Streptosporangiaceae bacterium]